MSVVDDKIQCVQRCELSTVVITSTIRGSNMLAGWIIKVLESHYCVHRIPTFVHMVSPTTGRRDGPRGSG